MSGPNLVAPAGAVAESLGLPTLAGAYVLTVVFIGLAALIFTNNPNSIGINIDDKNVCPGETFFVDIKVEDFSQIVKMMFD